MATGFTTSQSNSSARRLRGLALEVWGILAGASGSASARNPYNLRGLVLKDDKRHLLGRAARFIIVGTLGTLLDMALFAVLHLALGLAALPANALSYSAGIVNNFLLHRRWTFAPSGGNPAARPPALRQFARFAAVSLSALALNTLVVLLLAPALGSLLPDAAAALAAKVCATGLGMVWNYFANHAWTFRPEALEGQPQGQSL